MAQCKAETKNGHRCKNLALDGKKYCAVHKDSEDTSDLLTFGLGSIAALACGAGLGVALLAGTAAYGIKKIMKPKTKVFISFDFDKDKSLKEFIIGQASLSDSPFEVVDCSLQEAAPEDSWELDAAMSISKSDIVLVMVGEETYRASGVLKEIEIARSHQKPVVQVIGHKNRDCPAVPGAGRLYKWNWENLKKILS